MTRAERKTARRDLAAWLRARGLAPAGEVWRLAWEDGCRDVDTLARAGTACGALVKVTPAGERMPIGLRDGLTLPDGTTVIGAPVVDTESGTVWVSSRGSDGVVRDIEMAPLTPIGPTRPGARTTPAAGTPNRTTKESGVSTEPRPARTAPGWVLEAAAEYRAARDAWEAEFERETHQSYAPGIIARERRRENRGGRREVTDYLESHPAPVYRDHLRAAAARLRESA